MNNQTATFYIKAGSHTALTQSPFSLPPYPSPLCVIFA